MSEQKETGLKITMNKPLVEHIYTADPSAHVFNGRIYIYPSHDQDIDFPSDDEGNQYQMKDYHVLSMGIGDTEVTDHGVVLSLEDIPWASKQLWAPDAAFKNGKYYFYFPARDKEGIFRIGVAVGDRPEGPFIPQESFIPGSYSIDPAVFVDDDGRAYMYFGGLWGGQLQNWQTGTFDKTAQPPAGDELALGVVVAELSDDMLTFKAPASESKILDDTGRAYSAKEEGQRFFEGPWMHKYNGLYYLSYSTGTTHYLVYATSESPMGPFTYRGRILEPVLGWTTHHSIVEFEGKWYLFYHDASLSGGVDCKRSVKYAELTYAEDGSIHLVKPE
ncbi:MAG: family 43 glycosylhydrolase [Clostridiaceae bacterium]|nr:family 43 glycosylhydrolase [Clostridiaceae bacterium]